MTAVAAVARATPPPAAAPRAVFGAALVIAVAALAAYANSLSGPFIFDDPSSIVSNPTIRSLWPPWDALAAPRVGVTVGGRPVLNLSLAVNYALGGTNVVGYHVGNLAIHLAAALALFGLVRRTLLGAAGGRFAPDATFLAAAAAGLWVVHPLQTESVTYVIQRAESLMGMFYLLTLYCFARSVDSTVRVWWSAARVCPKGSRKAISSSPPFLPTSPTTCRLRARKSSAPCCA